MAPPRRNTSTKDRNSSRRNGKGVKQKPGVSPKAHPGRTTGGYSPAALARRAAIRAAKPKTTQN